MTSTPDKKLERYRARHPELTEAEAKAEIERRSASQLPDEEKARRADIVIDNGTTLDSARTQVKQVYEQLAALAG